MKLFRRSHQIAEYLCQQIQDGSLINPLPNTRQWAAQLGVGVVTLQQALHIVKYQGYISIRNRQGVSIIHSEKRRTPQPPSKKVVRLFFNGQIDASTAPYRWFTKLSQYLQQYHIQVFFEKAVKNHLFLKKTISSNPGFNELWLLAGILPEDIQRSFMNSPRPVIMIGKPAAGISIPYVNYDIATGIRHSVHAFGRQRMPRITLIIGKTNTASFKAGCKAFHESCKEWGHRNIQKRIILMPAAPAGQPAVLRRLADKYSASKEGFILLFDQHASILSNLMLAKGLKIPRDVDFRLLLSTPESENFIPNIAHYPIPIDNMLHVVRKAILSYYETGKLPSIHYECPLKAIEPARKR